MLERLIQTIECGDANLDDIAVGDFVIPNAVKKIGDCAFYDCTGLTSVTIPDSVTEIGDSVFEGCTGLTSVTIPKSVTTIGHWAFAFCHNLTNITIPDSVTRIGVDAFGDCPELTVCVHDEAHLGMVRDSGFDGNINIINNEN